MKKIDTYQAIQQNGILLNANESSKNLADNILKEIQEAIVKIDFNRYPDDHCESLCKAYAKYVKLDPKQVMVGNGSDEMLGLLIGLNISSNKKLYTLSPDFSMYDYYVGMHNGTMLKYKKGVDDHFDVDDFIAYGKENEVDMVLFSNPNNPTGKVLPQETLCKIVESFADKYVIIDEAYVEFDESSMLTYLNRYENLLITRTLSKAFSLAGIRCGFLLGNIQTMTKLKPFKVPYNVNSVTQCVAEIVLSHQDEIIKEINQIKQRREKMYQAYKELKRDDITLYESKANFFYGKSRKKKKLMQAFQQAGIVIRDYDDDSFRISIGSDEENQKVLEVLKNF